MKGTPRMNYSKLSKATMIKCKFNAQYTLQKLNYRLSQHYYAINITTVFKRQKNVYKIPVIINKL